MIPWFNDSASSLEDDMDVHDAPPPPSFMRSQTDSSIISTTSTRSSSTRSSINSTRWSLRRSASSVDGAALSPAQQRQLRLVEQAQQIQEESDISFLLQDPEQFARLKQELRRQGAVTNGTLQHGIHIYALDYKYHHSATAGQRNSKKKGIKKKGSKSNNKRRQESLVDC